MHKLRDDIKEHIQIFIRTIYRHIFFKKKNLYNTYMEAQEIHDCYTCRLMYRNAQPLIQTQLKRNLFLYF